jgi:acetoin utilization protein AcuB
MIAKSLLSTLIPSLSLDDTGEYALSLMTDFHVRHLPIVAEAQLLGIISEGDIFDIDNLHLPFSELLLSLPKFAVNEYEHLYEVVKMLVQHQLSLVPVVDEQGFYLGVITPEALLANFATAMSMTETGSVLVLEANHRHYSLAEIARLAEFEQANILSASITSAPNSATIEVTLKFSTREIARLVATYERFGYVVKASFQESDYTDDLKERYDALMSYLNV